MVGVPQLLGSGGPDGVTGAGGNSATGGAGVVVMVVVVVVVVAAGGGVHAATINVITIQRECLIVTASRFNRRLLRRKGLRKPSLGNGSRRGT